MPAKIKYLYILSQRYSGSTLLSFLLGTHPDIATIGERRKFYNKSIKPRTKDNQRCSCGKSFTECEHWNAIKQRVLEKVDVKDLQTNATEFRIYNNRYLNRLASGWLRRSILKKQSPALQPFARQLKRLYHFNKVLVQEILDLEGKRVFLDSSKTIDHALYLSQIPEFDLYIIWLARDPRAQVNSALKYNDWSIEQATSRWKKEMARNEKILRKMNARYTVLRYESLCKDPAKEMVRLLEFTGLDPSKFSLDFRSKEQHIMGNYAMRLGKDTRIVERKDWQEKLSSRQIDIIEQMTRNYREYYSV